MMEAVEGVVNPDLDQRGWHIVVGIVTALAGIVVIGAPFGSLFTLTVVGGVLMIVVGFVRCLEAFWLRSMRVT